MKALFIISGLGILAMLAEIFKFKRALYPLVLIGILAALVANFTEFNNNESIQAFNNMIRFDNVALAFSSVILITAFLWFILANDYFTNETSLTDHFSLVLFALTGALMLTAFSNMTTLFLGIEILSIPLYVLAASKKNDVKSNEAGFKYLIMGSFASAFLLFGIALIYGATGTFDLLAIRAKISEGMPLFFYAGIIMMLIAMCFKVSAAPFHFWAPDVYHGSPTVIMALMSTVVKTAAFVAFMRLFLVGFGSATSVWAMAMAGIIALSLIISNMTAAAQSSVKRMLAYSSISHAAFMLMGILAVNPIYSMRAILYYALAYSVATIGGFTVLYRVEKQSGNTYDDFNGLAKRNPFAALGMLICMLSLAGIPVTAGFFAKYFIFTALIGSTYKWLLVLAVIMSCVGVYYYIKVIIAMYFKKPTHQEPLLIEKSHTLLLAIAVVLVLVLGLLPNFVLSV
ncbi:MAG: NADH-quinone oxidoreductase subunit N [Bacteroidetes bacterium]|nr:NADH-quinone oxidoreductase subunit N [Bacteroidota bacterium]